MTNEKNEHIFPKRRGWAVRRESSRRVSRLFDYKQDALDYAGTIALNEGGSVVFHKDNGQFKEFRNGPRIRISTSTKAVPITETIEIQHPVINNLEPIVETRRTK